VARRRKIRWRRRRALASVSALGIDAATDAQGGVAAEAIELRQQRALIHARAKEAKFFERKVTPVTLFAISAMALLFSAAHPP